ncbi:MAG TPA: DUF6290 family protein [Spirochaetota bacterium]|jgi:predicted DNA-binding protein|nr:MAG: hypothetical protein BWX91_02226 [Spirochaetes bacterium ADurb.Bin133]HNZ28248.1 DUF6290 family protein [Spirochaetota bacterium]HOF01257.1 DUF6290 family protein [Spirochaetota bacterium]HOS33851.1 DUF6290 family protein [Spirochaetota bacterium]HOS56244.1 DUF6290 family protein [Spirochaetota bacterium]
MAITSIRFNKDEEKVLNYLKEHLHYDTSTLLKKALFDLYEDFKDREIIDKVEEKSRNNSLSFCSFNDLLSD